MNLAQDQIDTIASLGYTETEASFLYLVATYSGYFTLRQFLSFAGAYRGKRSTSFAGKLLRHGHASIRDYLGAGSVFHLYSRHLYGPIEKDNLRNRRRHSFEYIRTRLVLLDFILQNLACEFLETENDKVRFFCETLAVPKELLPAKVYEGGKGTRPTLRYFVDKFPLAIDRGVPGSSPVATFSYVDSGSSSLAHFGLHLAAYQGLFRCLAAFRFLYIATRPAPFPRAEKRFRSCVQEPLESDASSEVLRYFTVRRKWERHEYIVPVTQDLEFLREARRRFHTQNFEDLYQGWLRGEVVDERLRAQFAEPAPHRKISFETYLVRAATSPVDERQKRHVNVA